MLAFAYKKLPPTNAYDIKKLSRESLETDLVFAGFLVLSCPMKSHSKKTIEELEKSSHRTVMITGDASLTACHVATQLGMAQKPLLILEADAQDEPTQAAAGQHLIRKLQWVSTDETIEYTFDAAKLASLVKSYDLCVAGSAIAALPLGDLEKLVPLVRVFARCSPTQKETVLSIAKQQGSVTLMCGDGTNDVGALKQAHVGIALLNNPTPIEPKAPAGTPAAAAAAPARELTLAEKQLQLRKAHLLKLQASHGSGSAMAGKLAKALEELEAEEENLKPVKLGDASIAAPFTVKSHEPLAVVHIIRQGRCTLVATLQIYKILALNCLVSAYSMSVLALDGFKLGDTQMMAGGITLTAVFLFVSRSKPAAHLSKERPVGSIFTPAIIVSILGQFAINLFCLISVSGLAHAHLAADKHYIKPDVDTPFKANLVNTVVFLMLQALQLSNIVVNYQGRPFMEGLFENKGLKWAVVANAAITIVGVLEIFPPLNYYIELVPLPTLEFKMAVLHKLGLCFFGAFLWDRLVMKLLKPKQK